MTLDKHWQDSDLFCPFCKGKLLEDTHFDKDATHYCESCGDFLIICGNGTGRGNGI